MAGWAEHPSIPKISSSVKTKFNATFFPFQTHLAQLRITENKLWGGGWACKNHCEGHHSYNSFAWNCRCVLCAPTHMAASLSSSSSSNSVSSTSSTFAAAAGRAVSWLVHPTRRLLLISGLTLWCFNALLSFVTVLQQIHSHVFFLLFICIFGTSLGLL